MSDIVELEGELLLWAKHLRTWTCDVEQFGPVRPLKEALKDSAAEITRLRDALRELCEAVDDFICGELAGDMPTMDFCQANPEAGELLLKARTTLEQSPKD